MKNAVTDLLAYSYQILGAGPSMSDDELKKQYRIMVKKYHPDADPNSDEVADFQRVQNAYEYILAYRRGDIYVPPESPETSRPKTTYTRPTYQPPRDTRYAEAERMQREYLERERARRASMSSQKREILEIEKMGIHTAAFFIISLITLLSLFFLFEGNYIISGIMLLIPLSIILIGPYLPIPLDWRYYFGRLASPELRNDIIRIGFLIVYNIFFLYRIVFYTVRPVYSYFVLVALAFLLAYYIGSYLSYTVKSRIFTILVVLIHSFYYLNMLGAQTPWQDVKLALYRVDMKYGSSMEFIPSDIADYYKHAFILNLIPSGRNDIGYEVFRVRQGYFGLDVVSSPRFY